MSKSLNRLTYSVLEVVSNFFINDDFPITSLWVEEQLISQNHTLIRKAHVERRIDEMLYLTDENLELKPLNEILEYEGVLIDISKDLCYVDINELLTGLQEMEIQFVSNASMDVLYNRVSIGSLLRRKTGYYDDLPFPDYAVMKERLLFRKGPDAASKFINVSGIWRDPRLVSSWDPDAPFPTPSEKNLELLTVQHIGVAGRFPVDLINDAQRAISQPENVKSNERS